MQFITEKDINGTELNRRNVKGKGVYCSDGLCMANISNPQMPRDRKWYLENVINPCIKAGTISDGSKCSYDDRKPRLHQIILNDRHINVQLGITTYQDATSDVHRSRRDNLALQERGINELRERYAFFSRAPGVTAVPLSLEKSIFLGQRINTKEFPGFLNAVSGYIDYKENPGNIILEQNARRELKEEFGINTAEIISAEFIGVFGNSETGEADFTYLIQTNLPDKYFFSEELKKRVKKQEHEPLIKLSSYEEITRLLKGHNLNDYKII